MNKLKNRFEGMNRLLPSLNIFYQKHWLIILTITLVGLYIWTGYRFAWATAPHGIGVRSDSVAYFWSAHNLADGVGMGRITANGDFKPMTHWPPLYPMALSIFELVGVPALDGARWLGIFLFAAIILLTGLVIARFSHSFWFSFLGAFILSICPAFWETGLYAMTEPFYLVFYLLSVLLLDQFLLTRQWRWLVVCGLASASCFLTRYVGFTLVGAFVLVIFLQPAWTFFQRLKRGIVFACISIFPIILWMIRNAIQGGSPTNRSFLYYPVSNADFHLAWETISGWFAPDQAIFQVGVGKIIVILAVLILFFAFKRVRTSAWQSSSNFWIPISSAIYVVLYSFGVLASRYFMDPLITFFEQRIVFLIFIPILFMIIFSLDWLLTKAQNRSIYLGAVVLIFAVLVVYSYILVYPPLSQHFIDDSRERGLDYSDKSLKNTCLMTGIKDIPLDYKFYTDNIERLYFFTQRNSNQVNDKDTVEQLGKEKPDQGMVFVMFNNSEMSDLVKKQFPHAHQVCGAPIIEVIAPMGQ